jgi:hypothetical protein
MLVDHSTCRPVGVKKLRRVPTQPDRVEIRPVGLREACRQRLLHPPDSHRVRARLEHGKNACVAYLRPQSFERDADRRRVMREVVIDRDAALAAANLHPAPHSFE